MGLWILSTEPLDFIYRDDAIEHFQRRRDIFAAHPDARKLIAKSPWTAAWVVGLGALQFAVAFYVGRTHWWIIPIAAYLFGAFVNHALYVLMHECVHDTPFEKQSWNRVLGICCDFALMFPSAMGFRKYHLMHHKYLGQYERDPDVVMRAEAEWMGNSTWRKALWVACLSVSQMMRPYKEKVLLGMPVMDRWTAANMIVQVLVDLAVLYFLGIGAFAYLLLSTVFALGLHPLGGRWIQEHYATDVKQDTYSYYGILNRVSFNMGYHVEHHDFANVPWNNLPKLKAMAPEFYDNRSSYRSWTRVVLNFIFNPKMSAYSRIIHPHAAPPAAPRKARPAAPTVRADSAAAEGAI
jgi:sphingolipid delta-4 desaturase